MVSGRPLSTTVEGYIEPNQYATYSVNSLHRGKRPRWFGHGAIWAAAMAKTPNCLPIH